MMLILAISTVHALLVCDNNASVGMLVTSGLCGKDETHPWHFEASMYLMSPTVEL